MIEIRRYTTAEGRDIFGEWLASLADSKARARIAVRIDRLASVNFGDSKSIGKACANCVSTGGWISLCGGDKRKQSADIKKARAYWKDYKKRMDAE